MDKHLQKIIATTASNTVNNLEEYLNEEIIEKKDTVVDAINKIRQHGNMLRINLKPLKEK